MKRTILTGAIALTLACGCIGQTLAHSLPKDTLVYARSWSGNPIDAMKKMMSGGGLYESPVDVDAVIDMMDEGLQSVSAMMDMGDISIGSWLRSIRGYEAALTRFELTDSFPEMDFVFVLHTSMADRIYEVVSGKLIEDAVADPVNDDEMELAMGEFGVSVGKRDDMIILASDQRQLRETMSRFGSVRQGSLAQSSEFKRAVGDDSVPDYCLFINAEPWLRIAREEMDATGITARSGSFEQIATSLGLFRMGAMGWTETETHSHMAMVGNGDVPLFQILDCGKAGHDRLDQMPADAVFVYTWNGSTEALWRKGMAFIMDETKLPMAPMIQQQMIGAQKQLGVRFEDIAAVGTGGISVVGIPDADGQIDDDEENGFLVIETTDPAAAEATLADLITKAVTPRGGELAITEEGGRTWFRIKGMKDMGRIEPCMVFDGDSIIIGVEEPCRRALDARSGATPSLARYGVCKGLPQQASSYAYVSLKALMTESREFGAALSNLRDGAGIAAAIDVNPDSMVIRTSRPISQIYAAFGSAMAMREQQRSERRAIMKDLETIAKAYRAYKAEHGKDPKSMSALGFTGDKALSYPPGRAGNIPGKPYKLVSTEGTDPSSERWTIVVTCPDARFGRLVGTLSGDSRELSESRFRRQFQRQRAPK